jgi:adenylosuccinate lyase
MLLFPPLLEAKPDLKRKGLNLAMPGHSRYQPEVLRPYFGYDIYQSWLVRVEAATLIANNANGKISDVDIAKLTPIVFQNLLNITTTEVDEEERRTKHDIRALINCAGKLLPDELAKWFHLPNTSYDVICTANAMMFQQAHYEVVGPALAKLIEGFADLTEKYADIVQIGRSHGQHALGITIGFWLATILERLCDAAKNLSERAADLRGKISGAVGAHNAQMALGFQTPANGPSKRNSFEHSVLLLLELEPGRISTQLALPERMIRYLAAAAEVSRVLEQFGTDARQLMRTEIGEFSQPAKKAGEAGSSTMAHKSNPQVFESLVGMGTMNKWLIGMFSETLVSEHQRDLTGSAIIRKFPEIIVNLMVQVNALLRTEEGDADGLPFIARCQVHEDACERNFNMSKHLVMAEALFILLQEHGGMVNAHKPVGDLLVPYAKLHKCSLVAALEAHKESQTDLWDAWQQVPDDQKNVIAHPEAYIGDAAETARLIAADARETAKMLL